jgi:hypothetical protein
MCKDTSSKSAGRPIDRTDQSHSAIRCVFSVSHRIGCAIAMWTIEQTRESAMISTEDSTMKRFSCRMFSAPGIRSLQSRNSSQ